MGTLIIFRTFVYQNLTISVPNYEHYSFLLVKVFIHIFVTESKLQNHLVTLLSFFQSGYQTISRTNAFFNGFLVYDKITLVQMTFIPNWLQQLHILHQVVFNNHMSCSSHCFCDALESGTQARSISAVRIRIRQYLSIFSLPNLKLQCSKYELFASNYKALCYN